MRNEAVKANGRTKDKEGMKQDVENIKQGGSMEGAEMGTEQGW